MKHIGQSAATSVATDPATTLPVITPIPGPPFLMVGNSDLAALGYTLAEFRVAGTAQSYRTIGEANDSGDWSVEPEATASYVTRIVAIRPADPDKFNGTVIVEWLNVTGGLDVPVEWTNLHREILRSGYAYVAVSAQSVGVEGGASFALETSAPLKKVNPERYSELSHPNDSYAYDIYSQVGRALKGASAAAILGELMPERLLAVGESQAATYLSTYVNAIDPLAQCYDGYLIHSRFGPVATLSAKPITELKQWPQVKFRADLRVPVLTLITETDLTGTTRIPGYLPARTPDHDRLRVWEIAGTAHADNYLFTVGVIDNGAVPLEQLAAAWAPTNLFRGMRLDEPINNAPQHHYVTQAALWNLDRWLRTGTAPARTEPLQVDVGATITLRVDSNGNAAGGLRTPWVDVPIAQLSGSRGPCHEAAEFVGSTLPFDQTTLDHLYPGGKVDYMAQFETALAAAIKRGFILAADRQEILALAHLLYPGCK